jgi:hypothetical protein
MCNGEPVRNTSRVSIADEKHNQVSATEKESDMTTNAPSSPSLKSAVDQTRDRHIAAVNAGDAEAAAGLLATFQPKDGSAGLPASGTYLTVYARLADGRVRMIRDTFNGMPG